MHVCVAACVRAVQVLFVYKATLVRSFLEIKAFQMNKLDLKKHSLC